ncbi:hypothetical protein D9V41_07515 [Aeromicrobium phragmitis]|uniref:Uncharacterized protein n=1 Tax=Aeromicrobium phragmitis TaxID=2478914 RepID=A0A3L8PP95_9ACTN|nr:hypothetical protein [Aeromicrobium phragmitis]RLV56268.1 hypothetical protein D9V41_07515 [Aeromicrobium phragmitis]
MSEKRESRARRKQSRDGSRFTVWAAVGLLLFFGLALVELVPLLVHGLARAFELDGDAVIERWPLHPGYWVSVLVFAAPLVVAMVFALATRFLAHGKDEPSARRRWSGVILGLAVAYSVAVQWTTLTGTNRPLISGRVSDGLTDLPLGVVDVLRVAAYPSLAVLLGTFAAVVVVGLLSGKDRPRIYAWSYLAVATVGVVLVGWLNGNRYF